MESQNFDAISLSQQRLETPESLTYPISNYSTRYDPDQFSSKNKDFDDKNKQKIYQDIEK